MLDRFRGRGVLISALTILLGVGLMIYRQAAVDWAVRAIAIGLLAVGGLTALNDRQAGFRGMSLELAGAIAAMVVGLILLLAPRLIVNFFMRAVGFLALIQGLINILQANDQRKSAISGWQGSMAMSAITLAIALVVIFRPSAIIGTVVFAAGAMICWTGVNELWIQTRQ